MYNSLSNIQKHLYSLIKQNNPEYLQQSINEEGAGRSRRPNLANPEAGERLADFEGLNQQNADELRAKRKAGEQIRDREAGYKVNDKGETEFAGGNKVKDPELIAKYQEKAEIKDKNTQEYYSKVIAGLPADPTKYTERQAADVAMMKVIYNTKSKANNALKRVDNPDNMAIAMTTSTSNVSDDLLADLSGVNKKQNNPSPSTQSRVALRYQKKAQENALPLGERPISPFYNMTRNQFNSTFGRDFDESGGANTNNMMALRNNKNNLGQKLQDIEMNWHDDQSEKIMTDLMPDNPNAGNMLSWYVKSHAAVRKNDRDNPTYIYPETSLDVPPELSPRERARIKLDAAGNPIDPNDPRSRRLPTSPIDTNRKTRDPFTGEEEWKMFDINLDQPKSQTSNLTGKSVNSKVSRIA